MSTKAFNKRMHFIAQVANQGQDVTVANEWYNSLTIRDRRDTPNGDLVVRFLAWLPEPDAALSTQS